MQWCHWQCCQHHMMLMPGPFASHDQKSNVALHFDHLDLRNAIMPLILILAPCDTSANGNAWPEMSYCVSSQSAWPGECRGTNDDSISITWCWHWWQKMTKKVMLCHISIVVPLEMLLALHDASASGVTWPKMTCCFHFECLNARNGAIYDVCGIMSCWSQWHQVTPTPVA